MTTTQVVLFTDFGLDGIYTGQVEQAVLAQAPDVRVLNYVALAPRGNPRASAYLLEAYARPFRPGTVFLSVVDPGVGSFVDPPVAVFADGRWFVGPDNGLFEMVRRRARELRTHPILVDVGDARLSASFHGRDLYARVAAEIASGRLPQHPASQGRHFDFPNDLFEVVYIDHYGNGITGVRAERLRDAQVLFLEGREIPRARTFSDVPEGEPMFYANANGLIEFAVNNGHAGEVLGVAIGTPFAERA